MAIAPSSRPGQSVALPVELDRGASLPLAAQLADGVRRAALDGHLREGDRLPSTRALAERLGVSRTVTAAAYDALLAEGWLRARTGAGTFVAAGPPAARPAAASRPAVSRPAGTPAGDLCDRAEPLLSLHPGQPWVAGIDPAAWRRAWRRAGDRLAVPQRVHAGATAYRQTVVEHLLHHRGLLIDPAGSADVVATAGISAAVGELALAVLHRGDRVAIEEPGYGRAAASLRAAGVDVVPVPVDADGLDPTRVPDGVRAVYCTPAHQYPLGGRMPLARRVALVERARREGLLVIEDDYDGELRFDVAPAPVLAALGRDVVVHLGTTSKILSPALGCGWMVAPPDVVEQVLDHRRRTSTAPPLPGQLVVAELARTGDLARHLRRVRRELSARRAGLVAALAAHGVAVPGADAGAHVVVPLPDAAAERDAVAAGARAGLGLDPLSRHYLGPVVQYGLVVSYAVDDRECLDTVTRTLLDLLPPPPR